jgi:hypothetical protein
VRAPGQDGGYSKIEGEETRVASHDYELRFSGEADRTIRAAFPEFDVTVGQGTTVLRGRLPDQAALHGALDRIQDLGLELLQMRALIDDTPS